MRTGAIIRVARLISLLLLASSAASSAHADPITYNVTPLSYLNASGFDQSGNVIGQYSTYLTFVYTASGPNAGLTQTFPIADTPPPHPLEEPGPLPGYYWNTVVGGNNASGQEIGFSIQRLSNGDQGTQTGWLYSGGQLIALPSLLNNPIAINASGQIIGNSIDATGNSHALVYSNGQATDLRTLGGASAGATGINNQGQIVGSSTTYLPGPIGSPTEIPIGAAFIYENGKMYNLNGLLNGGLSGIYLGNALGINDFGQILVQGSGNGVPEDFLLTPSNESAPPPPPPIPEPSTLALIGLTIVAVGTRRMLRSRRESTRHTDQKLML